MILCSGTVCWISKAFTLRISRTIQYLSTTHNVIANATIRELKRHQPKVLRIHPLTDETRCTGGWLFYRVWLSTWVYNYCPQGLLFTGPPKIDVCASRPSDRPSVRAPNRGPISWQEIPFLTYNSHRVSLNRNRAWRDHQIGDNLNGSAVDSVIIRNLTSLNGTCGRPCTAGLI